MNIKNGLFTLLLPKMDKDIKQHSLLAQLELKYSKYLSDIQKNKPNEERKILPNTSDFPLKKRINSSYFFLQSIHKAENTLNNSSRNVIESKSKVPTSSLVSTFNHRNDSKHPSLNCFQKPKDILNKKKIHKSTNGLNHSSSLFTTRSRITGLFSTDNKTTKSKLELLNNNNAKESNRPFFAVAATCRKRTTPTIITLRKNFKEKSIQSTYRDLFNKYQRNCLPKSQSHYSYIKKKINLKSSDVDLSNTFCDELLKSIDKSASSYTFIRSKNEELIHSIKHDKYEDKKKKGKLFSNYSALHKDYICYNSIDNQNDIKDDLKEEFKSAMRLDHFSKMVNYLKLKSKLNIISKINSNIAYSQSSYISNNFGVEEIEKEYKRIKKRTNSHNKAKSNHKDMSKLNKKASSSFLANSIK